jgi:hypothetical protein
MAAAATDIDLLFTEEITGEEWTAPGKSVRMVLGKPAYVMHKLVSIFKCLQR